MICKSLASVFQIYLYNFIINRLKKIISTYTGICLNDKLVQVIIIIIINYLKFDK